MSDIATPLTNRSDGLAHLSSGRARAAMFGALWSFLNIAVSTLLAAGVFLVTSRILLPDDFGAVAFAASIITVLAVLIPTAFGEALVQRKEIERHHLDTLFWLTFAVAALGYGALVVLSPSIAAVSEIPLLAAILPVLGLRLFFDALLTVPASLILRRMQFKAVAVRTTIANGIGAVVCLVMVLMGYALWALVVSQVITSLTTLVVAAVAAGWRPGVQLRWQSLRDLTGFGGYAMGGRMLAELRIDQFLLGALLGPAVLGLFFFGRRLFQMLKDLTVGVFSPVSSVLMASMQGEVEKRRQAYLIASYASAGLAFPVFGGLMAIAPAAVPWAFGPQWEEAVFTVQCFCVVGMMAGLGQMQAALIRNLGRPDWWFWYQAVVQLSTIPIVLLFYPLGLDAVMLAIVVRTLILWPNSVLMAQRMLGMRLWHYIRSLQGPLVGTAAMVAWVVALPWLWPMGSIGMTVLAQVASGAGVYAAVLLVTSFRRVEETVRLVRSARGAG
jgi:O-antigen/teichoic acid export membrane protein